MVDVTAAGEPVKAGAGDFRVEKFGTGEGGEDVECADGDESGNGDAGQAIGGIVGNAGIALALEALAHCYSPPSLRGQNTTLHDKLAP